MTDTPDTPNAIENGQVLDILLSKLKKSPRNARRTPHSAAAIEALAASIAAKGMLQKPVVEPELDEAGAPTGAFLVTIGEGRRLAQLLRAKRKEIRKSEPISCVVDLANDPHEISLDENVTRSDMHPADQFEAFRDLAERRGLGAEDIAARFGVKADIVRQRLRLGAVSPKLMAIYREGGLTLEQLMAFAVSEDHARQEQVFEQLAWNKSAPIIRRAMTETKVPANDRRAVFVGVEAYGAAGGTIMRDLFTEDGGGWFEDVALLDQLVAETLDDIAQGVREREGWKWAEAHADYPHGHGLGRVYPVKVERTPEQAAEIAALGEEYDALASAWDAVEELPPEVETRLKAIDTALQAFGDGTAYGADDLAHGGVFVVLGFDGAARIERGLIRPEDAAPVSEPEGSDEPPVAEAPKEDGDEVEDGAPDEASGAPLADRLVLDLTAQRTLALRNALAADPSLALVAVAHGLALFAFYPPYERASCLEIKAVSANLEGYAPGIADTPAGRQVAERHEAWAVRLPKDAGGAWGFVSKLPPSELLELLAHCAGLTLNAVHNPLDRKPLAWTQADVLAQALGLDMTAYWSPTVRSYLGRVTKAKIMEAVREAVSPQAAERIAGLKKPDMAEAAEGLLAGADWLPALLRAPAEAAEPEPAGTLAETAEAAAAA
jgi:ParB family chromosome partitioning protein